ncbi:hypothetical protein BOH72_12270 [Mycobacterium sp. WY10]|nr:hypothetical protein BOH72_12270 [Mycobacterium sp. WY10]
MSRIFLSHSSRDMRQAIALKQWLAEQDPPLANEIFLDIDPNSGLQTGTRWKEALRRANARCEAVVCLLSANWEASHECKVEYRTAENLNKQIFCARLEPSTGDELTAEWQRCDLFGAGPMTQIDIGTGPPVEFATGGLYRLRDGIRGAGIGADSFVWPPPDDIDRAPYRGWEPLDAADAAVFFGRDAQIIRALDQLRGMRLSGLNGLFVILGPSGSGKSSFLRAGLLPRLRREDRRFAVLPIVRPERNALTGVSGLAASIVDARRQFGLTQPSLGEVKDACIQRRTEVIADWLAEIRGEAARQLLDRGDSQEAAAAPTLVLPLDQAEELFSADASEQANGFLWLIARLAETLNANETGVVVAATVRTDRYEVMQTHPELGAVGTVLFDELKPMPATQFKEVIVGPAQRASEAGRPLRVAPDLVDRLLADSSDGADTLPILALTLSRLYADYGSSGELTLAHYEALGGMRRVVQSEIDEVLSVEPTVRAGQLEALRAAFIPWLATVNPDNDQPMRRLARFDDLPPASRPLIDALVAKRLMVKDTRDGHTVVEVALESLLRQWDELAAWLRDERQDLKAADDLQRGAAAWSAADNDPAWLLSGSRLAEAEVLIEKPQFRQILSSATDFVGASRAAEDEELAAQEAQRLAELRAAEERAAHAQERQATAEAHTMTLRKRSRILRAVLALTAVVAVVAGVGFARANSASNEAQRQFRLATSQRLATEAQAMLAGARPGGDIRALQELLASQALAATPDRGALYDAVLAKSATAKIGRVANTTPNAIRYSPDGRLLATGYGDGSVRLSDAQTGQPVGKPLAAHRDDVLDLAWSPDGNTILSACRDGTLGLWNSKSGELEGDLFSTPGRRDSTDRRIMGVAFSPDGRRMVTAGAGGVVEVWDVAARRVVFSLTGHEKDVYAVAFAPDGSRIATGSDDNTLRLWDAATGHPIGAPLSGHSGAVRAVAFSPDGNQLASGSSDSTVRLWDVKTQRPVGAPMEGHTALVSAVEFSADGTMVVSGSYDRTLRWWSVDTQMGLGARVVAQGLVRALSVRPGAAQVAAASEDGTVEIWNTADVLPLEGSAAAFTPDGQRLALGAIDGFVSVYDPGTGQRLGRSTTGHPHGVTKLMYAADGHLVSGDFNGNVWIWKTDNAIPVGAPVRQVTDASITAIALSARTHRFAVGNIQGAVRVGDTVTGQWTGPPMVAPGSVDAVSFTGDDSELVSVHADTAAPPTARRWKVDTGQLVGTEKVELLTAAAFASAEHLATGTVDGLVTVYGADLKPVGDPISGHTGTVMALAYTPDGSRLASADRYGSLRIWQPDKLSPIGSPFGAGSALVWNLALSPDGRRLASANSDGQVRLWPASATTADLCARLESNMSHRQWSEWVSPVIDYVATCPDLPIAPD